MGLPVVETWAGEHEMNIITPMPCNNEIYFHGRNNDFTPYFESVSLSSNVDSLISLITVALC